jgi:hypothetical protein
MSFMPLIKNRRSSSAAAGTVAAAIAVGSLVVAAATTVRADAATLAAVFPPWWPASRALGAAAEAGDVLTVGASPHVVIVRSARPNLPARLRLAGALILLNPFGASACEQPSA